MNINPLRLLGVVRRFSRFNPNRRLTRVQVRRSSLAVESLERRSLLAIDVFAAYHNAIHPTDVNNDGLTSPADALAVINAINKYGAHHLAPLGSSLVASAALPGSNSDTSNPSGLVDVNNDGNLSPADALAVINAIEAEQTTSMAFTLQVTDLNNNPITQIAVGQDFLLKAFVQDARSAPTQSGVYSAYLDINFEQALAAVNGAPTYPADYPNGHFGDSSTPGLLDEYGGFGGGTPPSGTDAKLLFTQRFTANQVGTLHFVTDGPDVAIHDLLFSDNSKPPSDEISFGAASLEVVAPTISIGDAEITEGDSGTQVLNFPVTISADPGTAVTIQYTTIVGSASPGSDYQTKTNSITFNPGGPLTQNIAITILGDTLNEATETFSVQISGVQPTGAATIADDTATGTITDNDTAVPSVSIADVSAVTEGNSGTTTVTLTISLSGPSGRTLTIPYNTTSGTATAPADFNLIASGSVVFQPGETQKTITVDVLGDTIDENDETFNVNIGLPAGNDPGVTLGKATTTVTITDDDAEPTVSIATPPSITEGDSGTQQLAFTVTLSQASAKTVTVSYSTQAGTATDGTDYVGQQNQTLTFAPGETEKTISIDIKGDLVREPDETFTVNLGAPTNATVATGSAVGTIVDNNDPQPTISIDSPAAIVEGNTGTKQLTFTISLSQASGFPVTVQYTTQAGSATEGTAPNTPAGADYIGVTTPQTVTFNPGETSKTITIDILGDLAIEQSENFSVVLANPTGATLAQATGTGTITDDDSQPTVSIAPASVSEGDAGTKVLEFTVTLSHAAAETVTVQYATTAGTATQGTAANTPAGADYLGIATPLTLTFAPGETSKKISVTIFGDTTNENDETFNVALANASGATIDAATATGTINNDDASISINSPVAIIEGNTGTKQLAFTVTLSKPTAIPVTVSFSTQAGTAADGADYVGQQNQTLTFAAGEITKTIIVNVVGDTNTESNETFSVVLSNPTNGTLGTATGTGTILDDDGPLTLSITNPAPATEGNSGATQQMTFVVTLSRASDQPVTVNYTTQDVTAKAGNDYTLTSGTVTFAPGETSRTVNVPILGDAIDENDETFNFVLSAPTGGATIAQGSATGTITDDDPPPTVNIADALPVNEGNAGTPNKANFTVTLSSASGLPVVVQLTGASGTATLGQDFGLIPTSVTFAPGETSKPVTIDITPDTTIEPNETFTVSLVSASNATLGNITATGTILNDDQAPTLSVNDPTAVVEGDAGTTSVTFTVTLSGPADQTVTVDFATQAGSATAGADFVAKTGTLTFAPGETSKTVTVDILGDTAQEPQETFKLALSNASNATIAKANGTATINDNDSLPTVSINDVTSTEGNNGDQQFIFTVTLSKSSTQPVTVNYTTQDGTALVGQDYKLNAGTLTFAPGETTKQISVLVIGDTTAEQQENFSVVLSNPSGATLADSAGTGTIQDDDATPTISVTPTASVAEGALNATTNLVFTVTLSSPSGQPVTVAFSTQDLTARNAGDVTKGQGDYVATNGTLTFAPGETTKTISVPVRGDNTTEDDETLQLTLNAPTGGANFGAGNPSFLTATGTITNDDPAPILSISDATPVNEGAANGTNVATFFVTLSNTSANSITVTIQTHDGTAVAGKDYVGGTQTLIFAPGDTTKQINVPIIGNSFQNANKTLTATISNPSGATISRATANATIVDDDQAPAFSISGPTTITAPNTGLRNATFTVTLNNAQPDQTTRVDYATVAIGSTVQGQLVNGVVTPAGADYIDNHGTLFFGPGETTKTITVPIVGSASGGDDRQFQVVLSNPSATAQIFTGTVTTTIVKPKGSIAGFVYLDSNNNGARDGNEKGLAGVLITMTGFDANDQPLPTRTTVTDANGNYSFDAVEPGIYTVRQTQPGNYVDGIDVAGNGVTNTAQQTNFIVRNDEFDLRVGPGAVLTNWAFGERSLAPGAITKKDFMGSNM